MKFFSQKALAITLCFAIILAPTEVSAGNGAGLGLAIVGGIGTVVAAPVALAAVGFTAGGIAAGSWAAQAMAAAAVANGGGIAATSIIATCQSIGAAGLALGTKVALGGIGAAAGAAAGKIL